MNLGFYELLIILAIVILIFGGRKLPEMARGMGKAIREFRKAAKEEDKQLEDGSSKQTSQDTSQEVSGTKSEE